MAYYKTVIDGIVTSVNTVNESTDGNISESEYDDLRSMFFAMPDGKAIHDNGDGTYAYVDAPAPEPSDEIDDSEALEILLGGAE